MSDAAIARSAAMLGAIAKEVESRFEADRFRPTGGDERARA
jgi:hypothetical protein